MYKKSEIKSEVRYEQNKGIHTYHDCICGEPCRAKKCTNCWKVILKIVELQEKIRILQDWEIGYEPSTEYKAQCSFNVDKHTAYIYGWPSGKIPKDYILHEMLHIALVAVRNRDYDKERVNAECFVQDICKLIEDK